MNVMHCTKAFGVFWGALLCALFVACGEEGEPTGGPVDEEAIVDDEPLSIEDFVSGSRLDGSRGFWNLRHDVSDKDCDECDDEIEPQSSAAQKPPVVPLSSSSSRVISGDVSLPGGNIERSSSSRTIVIVPSSSSAEKSCSSVEPEKYAIKNRMIMGVAQKGPFRENSSVTLFELSEDMNVTGKVFPGSVSSNQGDFIFPAVSLSTPYVMVQVTGNYRNEITGIWSSRPITLLAVSDLSTRDGEPFQRTEVNVNLLTHLEYERVWTLMDEGLDLETAKKQAYSEIMEIFHFHADAKYAEEQKLYNSRDGALLALSILFTGVYNEVYLEIAMDSFIEDFSMSGSWNDEIAYARMADFASEFNNESIHTWAAAWGFKSVPDFEEYLTEFWNAAFGLERCSAKNQGYVVKNTNEYSAHYGEFYTCENGEWI